MKSTHFLKNFLPQIFCFGGLQCLSFSSSCGGKIKDENGCCSLDIQEFGCREMSIFTMSLSRNISLYQKAMLLGRIGKILASTWFVCLVPSSDWSSTLVGIWSLFFPNGMLR